VSLLKIIFPVVAKVLRKKKCFELGRQYLIETDGKFKMQVGISQPIKRLDYDLEVRGNVVLFPAQALALSPLQSIQTGSETHAISYSINTERSLARGKEAEAQTPPFTLPSFQIKKEHICISTFPYGFVFSKVLGLPVTTRNLKCCSLCILFYLTTLCQPKVFYSVKWQSNFI
jgi:hypothetical protein